MSEGEKRIAMRLFPYGKMPPFIFGGFFIFKERNDKNG